MQDWIKTALTRRISRKDVRGRVRVVTVPPNEKLVLLVKFSLAMTVCLSALEVAHLAVLHSWNSEVFAGITSLIGTVSGVIVSHRV
jgi:hypothetical protein